MRQSLSKTMVWQRVESVGVQFRPGWLGLPVRAKLAHAVAIFFASAWASGVLPGALFAAFGVIEAEGSSAVCHAPATPPASAIAR